MDKIIMKITPFLMAGLLLMPWQVIAVTPIQSGSSADKQDKQKDKNEDKNADKKDDKNEDKKKPIANLRIEVTGGQEDQAIEGASVHVESEEPGVNFTKDMPTNRKGVATLSNVPPGKIVIQVTATGWETFGSRYNLKNNQQQPIKIELKPSK